MSDEPCPELGTYRVKWPGENEAIYCSGHADDLRMVAKNLDPVEGDPIVIEPLRGTIRRVGCSCTEGRLQIIHVRKVEANP
jgi:hypothetical protein